MSVNFYSILIQITYFQMKTQISDVYILKIGDGQGQNIIYERPSMYSTVSENFRSACFNYKTYIGWWPAKPIWP